VRILLALHQFFPEFRAGTETLARRTAEELQRRGHQVWLLTGGVHEPEQPLLRRTFVESLEVWRCNPSPPPSPLAGGMALSYYRPELEGCFQALLEELQPDLVHVFHLRRLTISLVAAASARGLPLVASLTDYWMACPTGQLQYPEVRPCTGPLPGSGNCLQHLAGRVVPPLRWLPLPLWQLLMAWAPLRGLRELRQRPAAMAEALARLDRVLVPTSLMYRSFKQLGFATDRFALCPYGLDLRGLEKQPARQPWPGDQQRPLRVGFIGSFTPAKGVHVLLEAVAALGPDWPAQVLIYGQASDHPVYAAGLQQQARKLPQVRWAGVFDSGEVFAVLAELDLLVVPSLWRENAPLIVLQALASGLPLLLSDVEGMADQVQLNVNAWSFSPGDSRALAALLQRASRRPAALADLINRGGQPRSIADYGDQLEHLYGQLLED
jgi:glycosyltransferase involved in cell wall biosynthesis